MNLPVRIEWKRLSPLARIPAYQTSLAAGMDVHAAITEPMLLEPNRVVLVPTGFALAIPEGFEAQVRPRSGLSTKHGVTVPQRPRHDRCRLPRRGDGGAHQPGARGLHGRAGHARGTTGLRAGRTCGHRGSRGTLLDRAWDRGLRQHGALSSTHGRTIRRARCAAGGSGVGPPRGFASSRPNDWG